MSAGLLESARAALAGLISLGRTRFELFGTKRAMFESNFPVDKRYYSYPVLWNAFKKLAKSYSADEKADLFFNAARHFYRLPL